LKYDAYDVAFVEKWMTLFVFNTIMQFSSKPLQFGSKIVQFR